jgi:hypothetical protein
MMDRRGSHPVDIATGAMFRRRRLPAAGVWVSFVRSYLVNIGRDIDLGRGWSHSLVAREASGDGLVLTDEGMRSIDAPFPAGDGSSSLHGASSGSRRRLIVDPQRRSPSRPSESPASSGSICCGRDLLVAQRTHVGKGEIVSIIDGWQARWLEKGRPPWWVAVTDAGGRSTSIVSSIQARRQRDLVRAIDAGGAEPSTPTTTTIYMIAGWADRVLYHFAYEANDGRRKCVETWGGLEGEDILATIGSPDATCQPTAGHLSHAVQYNSRETAVVDALGHRHVTSNGRSE